MEKQKLIYVESKALFSPSEVSDKAIVFIKDTKEIWTHGVYFSCSGTWATPITLSLTGDTTGSVSIDGSGNASIATTTRYLSGMSSSSSDCNSAATTLPGNVTYYPCVLNSATNKFPTSSNANAILSLNVHDYSYTYLLGFSSNGNIYYRRRNAGTWETSWVTILNSSNYTNFHHTFASLTNKPTTLSGYGITDCIPIISGGKVTTDTDLSTLGMTTTGAKLSVSHTTETKVPSWLTSYSNLLVFRSTGDTYSGIATYTFGEYVTFLGGRNVETAPNNVPNWWFRIYGTSGLTYNLANIQTAINNLGSTYLPLTGGTLTDTLILKAGAFTASQGNSYSGGRYHAVAKPNIRLIGDSTYGLSTIEFTSQKGDTSINKPSDSGFIQFLPYGVSALSAVGSNPTLKTSGETNALVLGVTNDADDIIVLQSPNVSGLRHACGTTEYYLPHVTTSTTTANKPLVSTTTAHVYTLGTECLPLSGGVMTGALNFANNTWNRVGDDAYMGDCDVAGMIGIKGSNADTPGFAMYNTAGTLLGKLYTNNSKNLYWTDNLILTSNNYESYINSSLYEANLKWGGKNLAGGFGPLDAALIDPLGPNRFAFLSYAGITVEYSTDSGATWTDYGLNDLQKVNLLSGNYLAITIGHNTEESTTVNRLPHLVRVVITTSKCSVYTLLHKFAMFITSYGLGCYCRIDARLQLNVVNNVDTWKVFSDSPISGWSGWNIINTSPITTYGNTAGTLYGQVRFTFYITSLEGRTRGLTVHSILGYGGLGWTTASNMARIGHLYSYDGYQNATFPARITATGFSGPLTGNVTGNVTGNADTASKWKDARTITLTGDVTGSVSLDGSSNVTLTTSTSGTGTTSFLKCINKRNSYPALIVTSGLNIGAAFMSASKLGLSDGNFYEAIILRGWADSSGGNENALLFSKNTSSVYHSQYAFGSTTTWGTIHKFLDSNNYSSYALPLSGGTMTGAITLTSGSDAANAKTALSFIKSSDKSEQARIGTDTANGLGMYAKGTIYIRPNVTLGSSSTNGLIISNSSFTYNGNAVLTSSNYTNYTIGYANALMNYKGYAGVISDGKLYYNNTLQFARFVQHDNSGRFSYELIAELTNYGTGTNTSYITYGISGFMWALREGNGANSGAYPITAIVNVGPAILLNMLRIPVTTNALIPFVVKYNDKYYIALRKNSSSTVFYFMGIKLNLLTTSIIVDDASLIEEIAGPITETSTASKFYNNGTPQEYLHAGNYSSYALPLTGGKLTGKLTMLANSLDNLPLIYRTDAAYISGIRFLNTLGYLGAIGMNAVNGSLYILDTANTTYTILDSRNYNNYAAAKSHTHPWSDITSKPGLLGGMANPIFYPYANDSKLGAYISTINNRFYSADLRYTVTTTGFASGDVHYLFDDNYDSRMQINMGTTATITIEGYNFVYNNGYIILYFYLYSAYPLLFPKSITAVATRLNGTTYTLNRATSIESGNTIAFSIGLEYLTKLEITIVSLDNAYCGITNIDYYSRRTENSVRDCAVVTKYNANTLYHNLTAPKYIVKNGTSSQFLKADGSLDSTSYLKVDGTNGTADGVSTLLNKLTTGTATPVDADYYICQYAGGGTTTTSYQRRPMSAMYAYIKSKATSDFLPLSGGTLGSSTASYTELFIKSSTAKLRLTSFTDSTTYIQSGNSDFTGNATLKITGYNSNTGSNLYLNFANIYCRANNYTNIDSGNYSSYALPLSGGTLTGTLISRDIRPSANVSYSLGTSSYYYNYVYAKYFKKNGSSDSYVLLGGGGHKAVSDFTMKELKTTTSISGNTDQWSIILEQSYPADHWYDIVNTFLVEGAQFGSGFLSFYAYWLASSSALKDYITEVYFNGTMRGEATAAFGGSNRDINDYLRIYIDKTNYKLLVYANHYNGKTVRIKRINYNEIDTAGFPNGGILVEHFNDKGTIVSLPTESSTMTRVLIKTHYNHDRTIKTSKSIYASSFYENSDIRLKENIRGIDLSDLTKLVDLVQFNFKDSDTKKYGVIAQLLELVGLQNLVYENDGKKAVDYISLLVLEMQRLRNKISDLEEKLNNKEQTS